MNTAVMESAPSANRSTTLKMHKNMFVGAPVVGELNVSPSFFVADEVDASHGDVEEVPAQLLTETELRAMPEHLYMNSFQLDFFKQRLEQMAHAITIADGRSRDTLRVADSSADPIDRASTEESYAREILTRDRDAKLAIQVRQALKRIESGDYGICEESGEPIGIARLLAQPTARMTTDAQNHLDQRKRMHRM
jgi:DnaK suppressor protein